MINWPNTNWSLKSIFVDFPRSFDQVLALYEWFYSKVLPVATDKDLMHPRKWTHSMGQEAAGWQHLMGEQALIKAVWGFDWKQISKLSFPGINNPYCCRVQSYWTLVFHCTTGALVSFFFLKETMRLILWMKGCCVYKRVPLFWKLQCLVLSWCSKI